MMTLVLAGPCFLANAVLSCDYSHTCGCFRSRQQKRLEPVMASRLPPGGSSPVNRLLLCR